jgi:hypothetical protein
MADDTHPKRSSRGFAFPVATLAIVLLLYALSPGPIWKYCTPTGKPPRAFEIAYAPLAWGCNHVPGVAAFYDWYFQVWGFEP